MNAINVQRQGTTHQRVDLCGEPLARLGAQGSAARRAGPPPPPPPPAPPPRPAPPRARGRPPGGPGAAPPPRRPPPPGGTEKCGSPPPPPPIPENGPRGTREGTMSVIVVLNRKGGVGKTSTCFHL